MASRYSTERFRKLYELKKAECGMRNCDVAQGMHVSERTIMRNLELGTWKFDDLRALFKVLRYTDDEILKVMRLGI